MAMQESPRLSFSNDVSPSPAFFRDGDDDNDSSSASFDFSTSFDDNYSPADLLFSKGKLLPLRNNYSKPSSPPLPPNIPNPPNYREGCKLTEGTTTTTRTVCPFPRSKSAGCNPGPNAYGSTKSRKKLWKTSSESSAKAYYYTGDRRFSYGNGVRIDPVINVPAPFIPRGGSSGSSSNGSGSSNSGGGGAGFFAYLLCNCRDKTFGMNEM